jgi:hypothetical protein
MSKAKPRELTAADFLAMADADIPPEQRGCNVPLSPEQDADVIADSKRWRAAKAGVTGSPESSLNRVELEMCRQFRVPLGTLNDMEGYKTLEYMEAACESKQPPDPPKQPPAAPKKPKRSTERDEARTKIIAALTAHHQFDNGSCLNLEPIGNNKLARQALVSGGSVSNFITKAFKGRAAYRAICRNAGRLADSIKALRGELSPHELYGRQPPGEGQRDEE